MSEAKRRRKLFRVQQNMSREEWLELRNYAEKVGLSMSQVLYEFSKGAFAEMMRGNDPLKSSK